MMLIYTWTVTFPSGRRYLGASFKSHACEDFRALQEYHVPMEPGPKADLRDYLAAERTLLAWIRTGLALMGFGFVVARFGLFLQEFQLVEHASSMRHYGLSLWFGTALIAAGVVVNLFAAWHHSQLIRGLDRGDPAHSRSSMQPIAIALFLALVGLAMAIYLVSVRS
jgi:putative membrane protein